MARFPIDDQKARINFFGTPGPGGTVEQQLIDIIPMMPFKLYYGGKLVRRMMMHKRCAPAFVGGFKKIWDYYGHDQAVIDQLKISHTAGAYNPRLIRGSSTQWSLHAFGCAFDENAEENGFNARNTIPLAVISAFKSEGLAWGEDYKHRKDPMHIEAVDRGEPSRTFEQWLSYYKQPLTYQSGAPVGLFDAPMSGIETEDDAPTEDGQDVDASAEPEDAPGVTLGGNTPAAPPRPAPAAPVTPIAAVVPAAVSVSTNNDDAAEPGPFGAIMKPLRKSRTMWVQSTLTALGLGGAGSQVDGITDAVLNAAHKPTFWLCVAFAALATYTLWLRYKDWKAHQT
jgi:hypothetical protein